MSGRDRARDLGKIAKKAMSRLGARTKKDIALAAYWRTIVQDYPECKPFKDVFYKEAL